MDEITRSLCAGPNFAHLATLMADGSPHSAPVWVDVDGDRLLIVKEEQAVAFRNVKRDPRVAISIIGSDAPYRCAYVRGRVVDTLDDAQARLLIDRLSQRYIGRDYPIESSDPMAVLVIDPVRSRGVDLTASMAE